MSLAELMRSFFLLVAQVWVRIYLGTYGGKTPKPIYVYSNNPSTHALNRKLPRNASWDKLCRISKEGSVTGLRKKLKGSQAYPKLFGKAVAELTQKGLTESTMAKFGFASFG